MKGGDTNGGGVWGISDPREVESVLKELDLTENAEEEG
jgi:[acyl-carrier-protein] S-malonyltransferase